MARTPLDSGDVTRLVEAGIDPTDIDLAANLTDGNSFPWAKNRLLFVLNGDTTTLTCTFPVPGTVGPGLTVSSASGTVATTKYKLFGPFDPIFQQDDGTVFVNYSGADASVTVALLDAD